MTVAIIFGAFFLKEKSNLVDTMVGLMKKPKYKYNLQVPLLWQCRRKWHLQKSLKHKGLGVDFEYTAPGTPQQNSCVKQKFATLFNQVHAMLNGRRFTIYLCNSLWAEAANTNMLLKNNLLKPNRNLSPFQQFFGKEQRSILSLMQKFGEMSIATYNLQG